jgi:GNAT superfamily N-acetyltransferase
VEVDFDVRVFDVNQASHDELTDYHQLVVASSQDWSDEPPGSYDATIELLRNPPTTFGPGRHWTAHHGGHLVGYQKVSFPEGDDACLGTAKITVHPDFRCRGIATALLRAALPALRSRGRTTLEGWSLTEGGIGDLWSAKRGFATVHKTVMQRLMIAEIDDSILDVAAVPGYRTASWVKRAPDELVASYAAAQDAIQDAPLGDTNFRFPRWTVERVRQAEADRQESGIEQPVVVAIDESTGDVVGYTEVELRPHREDRAIQLGTAVLPEHRGHGLGRLIKARMARWLRSEHGRLERVLTSTAASNTHMIRVNHQIGYASTRTMLVVSGRVDDIEDGLTRDR